MTTEKTFISLLCLLLAIIVLLSVTLIIVVSAESSSDGGAIEEYCEKPNTAKEDATPKKNYYTVTDEERELLARIVTCEASICSLECQKDVCSVIFNRLESGKWRKDMNGDGKITIYDIIYYPNAFSPTTDGAMDRCTTPCKSAYEAVDYVIENGPTVPTYVRYFRASYDFSWEGYENYKTIDNVYFGYFVGWHKGDW